jgi:hypothetical protein
MVAEERFITQYQVPSLLVVGWEGEQTDAPSMRTDTAHAMSVWFQQR